MHLSEIKKNATEEEKTSWPPFPSEVQEKEIVEMSIDRYIKLHANNICHTDWLFQIEEINSIVFDELEQWNDGWRFNATANVKQTDNCGKVHLTENLLLSGNVITDWNIKSNPFSPTDRDWLPEVKNLNITKISFFNNRI